MADLQEKYQKLAGEYAKLKAQIPVLKKAYLDEQGEVNQLKDTLKERNQTVRKYEQEVDSLTFRNQQLSKRVVFLQEELDASEVNNKKKNKNKGSEPTTPDRGGAAHNGGLNVFNEELQSKIEENALLHKQLQEVSTQFDIHVRQLQAQLKAAEDSKGQHEEVIHAAQQRAKEHIDRLQEEKAMLEVKVQTLESELKEFRGRCEKAEQDLNQVEKNLQSRLDVATKTIQEKLPFIDTTPFRITVIPWRDQSRCSDSKAGVSSVIFWWQYQSVEYGSLPTTKGVVTSVIFWWRSR
ncbi:protein phosphatase 1 regulatory subunit 21-like [Plakobranchus ocellatus]|uniref:Protein phosphatase 1 regulatory subunit 21-like n=1 Tax=Plakobranchus ocellatus TaxID=259542 RepID=A0AAV3ZMX7_9GAST|nr:protein phosphatase 1 regulatory subunit 21-like [Plakobranchus ocellatus]